MPADVGSINAGLLALPTQRRGATMALHAVCGFTGAVVGPVVFGAILDRAGGQTEPTAWIAAFAGMFGIVLLGMLILLLFGARREDVSKAE